MAAPPAAADAPVPSRSPWAMRAFFVGDLLVLFIMTVYTASVARSVQEGYNRVLFGVVVGGTLVGIHLRSGRRWYRYFRRRRAPAA